MKAPSNNTTFNVYNASAGSGKTFTLVKEYLKIILQSTNVFKFQQILAITFTNKAASEMKERIIKNLREFSDANILEEETDLFRIICEELAVEPTVIYDRSKKIIKQILNNYAAFNITTIDSFTYKLIRGFAFDLGLSLNFEVEMDAQSLLNEAVDVLISRIGEDKLVTKTLIDFSLQKANEDTSWDIALDLKKIAKLLLNEDDILQVEKINKRPLSDFIDLKNKLKKQQVDIEKQFAAIGKKGFDIITTTNLTKNDFSHRGALYAHFEKLVNKKITDLLFYGQLDGLIEKEHHFCAAKASVVAKDEIESIKDELVALYYQSKEIYETHYKKYVLNKLVSKSIIPLAVLHSINEVLTEIKEDNNIRLNSEFNQLISQHLKEQPVAFIYEKIGEKYRHYFIDEMQDTSVMQWENLIPLIANVLESENDKGEKGSLMLVGDAKQAIYRWRGGKAEQFISLAEKEEIENSENPFYISKKVNQLDVNWRSFSKVIEFNNSFFQFLSKHLKNEEYRSLYETGNKQLTTKKKGGFVQISFIDEGFKAAEKELIYPEKVLEIITQVKGDFNQNEISILTRTKKQGVAIANYLTEHNVPIISSETLLLQNSSKVQFIINLLYVLQQPNDEECKLELLHFLYNDLQLTTNLHTFLASHVKQNNKEFFAAFKKYDIHFSQADFDTLSLYDSVEMFIRIFKLTQKSDAYLQFFLDVVLDFSYKKTEGIDAFLNYWEERKEKLSIVVPDGKNAVKIMTIHKAKGLEFPVVIYPFDLDVYKQIEPKIWYAPLDKNDYNGFDTALVNYSKALNDTGEIGAALYNKQQEELELDNFNMVYVALTRASEQLYIVSEFKKQPKEPTTFAHFFQNYLVEEGLWNTAQSVYKFGDSKRIKIEEKKPKEEVVALIQETFISTNWEDHKLDIVIESEVDESDETQKSIAYGNLIHEILAEIITTDDVERVVLSFVNKGLVAIEDQPKMMKIIQNVVEHKALSQYYSTAVSVLNEREILTDEVKNVYDKKGDIIAVKKIVLIPDRLIFEGNKVTIIDYKTGKPDEKYKAQLTNYARVLTQMDYKVIAKLLVYINEEVRVVEVD